MYTDKLRKRHENCRFSYGEAGCTHPGIVEMYLDIDPGRIHPDGNKDYASLDKTLVICCDPAGSLWETSTRLRRLNSLPTVIRAVQENRLLIISPDHKVEAGFLCTNNAEVMRTFWRGQEQGRQWLQSDQARRFFEL